LTGQTDPGKLGLRLQMGERGLEVQSVVEGGPADAAGLREQDLVTALNGAATRYLPLGKVKKLMKESPNQTLALVVRRSAILTRK
jgi:C-terminal processing protease CtpA/Prc